MAYNLLIVDDSQTMRKVIRKSVSLAGVELGDCYEAGSGQEALKLLSDHLIDLIFTDLNMPEMDGLEFIRNLKRDEKLMKIPVVLITSMKSEPRIQEAMGLGIHGFIQKPFHPEALRDLLASK
jgi:two-component system, chemotaxis family, chemotaxis protein CheY